MKIVFLMAGSNRGAKWGGDLAVMHQLIDGLRSLGHESILATSPFEAPDADFVFVSISIFDHRQRLDEISLLDLPFGVLGFHEDLQQYYCPAMGFLDFVRHCLEGKESIEELYVRPHIIHYFGRIPEPNFVYNFKRLQKAKLWVANTPTEAAVVARDFPGANVAVVPVAPGLVTRFTGEANDSFLSFSGLSSGSYLLQIGRLEERKNQLAAILATRDLDLPLVFIATHGRMRYPAACFEAAAKWRKAPTLFISQTLKEMHRGSARVIPMPSDTKLPLDMILSAYAHTGLYIHPAFNELPGAIFLEAARLGAPAIATHWCTIKDYFFNPSLGHSELDGRIAYCDPWDLKEIQMLTERNFGKRFLPLIDHPTIQRTEIDAARELLTHLHEVLS